MIRTDAGDKKVHMAVVIEIRRRRPHRVPCPGKTGLVRHVLELHTAKITKQPVPELDMILLQRRDGGAVREENVRQAVSVVIERHYPAGHGLDNLLFRRRAVFEHKVDARASRHVAEPNWSDARSRLRPRPEQNRKGSERHGCDQRKTAPRSLSHGLLRASLRASTMQRPSRIVTQVPEDRPGMVIALRIARSDTHSTRNDQRVSYLE